MMSKGNWIEENLMKIPQLDVVYVKILSLIDHTKKKLNFLFDLWVFLDENSHFQFWEMQR